MDETNFESLVKLVTGQFSINELSGPVGIYNLTDQVVDYGFVLSLAVLSINLGLFNLLPVPALDGGRLFFFLIEALRGKPIDRKRRNGSLYWFCIINVTYVSCLE